MRFDGGINLLGFVLSNPDFLTGTLSFARRIEFLLNQTEKRQCFFAILNWIPRYGMRGESELLAIPATGARFSETGNSQSSRVPVSEGLTLG